MSIIYEVTTNFNQILTSLVKYRRYVEFPQKRNFLLDELTFISIYQQGSDRVVHGRRELLR